MRIALVPRDATFSETRRDRWVWPRNDLRRRISGIDRDIGPEIAMIWHGSAPGRAGASVCVCGYVGRSWRCPLCESESLRTVADVAAEIEASPATVRLVDPCGRWGASGDADLATRARALEDEWLVSADPANEWPVADDARRDPVIVWSELRAAIAAYMAGA